MGKKSISLLFLLVFTFSFASSLICNPSISNGCPNEIVSTSSGSVNNTYNNNTYITVNATVNSTQFDSNNPISIKQSWLTSFVTSIANSLGFLTTETDKIAMAYLNETFNATKEPTGFSEQGVFSSSLIFYDANRTFSICGSPTYVIYFKGQKITKTGCDSLTIPATAGYTNYIYFDGTTGEILTQSLTPWGNDFSNVIQVATVFWNGTNGLVGKERHGITMDSATHYLLHTTVGTRYVSGLNGIFTNPASWSLTNGTIADEDNIDTNNAQTRANLFYHTATGRYTFLYNQSNLYIFDGSNKLMYDNLAGLSEVDNNAYMAMWVVQTVDRDIPTYVILGQRQDVNLANARANNNYSALSLGALDIPEFKLLYRVILRRSGTSTPTVEEVQDLRSVSNLPSGAYIASSHSALNGLNNDDHLQYLLTDGSRNQTELLITNNVTAKNGFFNVLGDINRNIRGWFNDLDWTGIANANQGNLTNVSYIKLNKISNLCDLTINGSICSNQSGTYIIG